MPGEARSPTTSLAGDKRMGCSEFVAQKVLAYMSVRDLFNCCLVNRMWQRLSLPLLRKKLDWVLCCAPRKDGDESCCLQNYCSHLRRLCYVARQVKKKPALHFLLISASNDDERSVVNGVRQSLPHDCVTVLFKSKLDRTLLLEGSCKGLNGVVVFKDVAKGNRWALKRRNKGDAHFESSASDADSLGRVSKFLRRWVLGDRGSSPVACFKNTSAGVLTFQSRLSVPLDDAGHITTYCIEKATGYKLQVTTATLHAKMKRRSVQLILSLRDTFKNLGSTIVVVFQKDSVDMLVMDYLRCLLNDVPVISMGGQTMTEARAYTWDSTATPPRGGRVTVMVLTLLPKASEKIFKIKSLAPA
ncbi:uncharacterized protein LOC144103175 isoform X1 [Amblyomma americanum]